MPVVIAMAVLLLLSSCGMPGLSRSSAGAEAGGGGGADVTHIETTGATVASVPTALEVERRLTVILNDILLRLQRLQDTLDRRR